MTLDITHTHEHLTTYVIYPTDEQLTLLFLNYVPNESASLHFRNPSLTTFTWRILAVKMNKIKKVVIMVVAKKSKLSSVTYLALQVGIVLLYRISSKTGRSLMIYHEALNEMIIFGIQRLR